MEKDKSVRDMFAILDSREIYFSGEVHDAVEKVRSLFSIAQPNIPERFAVLPGGYLATDFDSSLTDSMTIRAYKEVTLGRGSAKGVGSCKIFVQGQHVGDMVDGEMDFEPVTIPLGIVLTIERLSSPN